MSHRLTEQPAQTLRGGRLRACLCGRWSTRHVERIYRKLDAHDRVTALATARERGILTGSPSDGGGANMNNSQGVSAVLGGQ
jgi:hypothetical protein